MNAMQCVACLHNYRTCNFLITSLTSKFGESWSPARQQLWPWGRSRSLHSANWKGLSQGRCMPNINALSLILQKIWARLKFCDRQTVGRTNKWVLMSPTFAKGGGQQNNLPVTPQQVWPKMLWSCWKYLDVFSEIKDITFFAKGGNAFVAYLCLQNIQRRTNSSLIQSARRQIMCCCNLPKHWLTPPFLNHCTLFSEIQISKVMRLLIDCCEIYSPKKVTHNFDWFYQMCVYVNYV